LKGQEVPESLKVWATAGSASEIEKNLPYYTVLSEAHYDQVVHDAFS
jgi:hypothetical protein